MYTNVNRIIHAAAEICFLYFFFFSFHNNKIHPVTNYKAIKNKINKTRQHRTFFFQQTKQQKKKTKKRDEITHSRPLSLHFEWSINQSYDQ